MDDEGYVYISDAIDKRIQVFASCPRYDITFTCFSATFTWTLSPSSFRA